MGFILINYSLLLVLIASLFFKKYILIFIGSICFLILLKDKENYKYYILFLILNSWIAVASLKQIFNFNYYNAADDIRHFDFLKQLLVSAAIYFSVLFVIKNNGVIKSARGLFIILLFSIIFSTYYVSYQIDYNFGDSLYGLIVNIDNGKFSWHWGSTVGLIGVTMPLYLLGFKKNSITIDALYSMTIGLYAFLLESRTLILYIIFFYINITFLMYRKNKYFLFSFVLLVLYFLSSFLVFLLDKSTFKRFTTVIENKNFFAETRVQLYEDFFTFAKLENIFGTLETAAKYTNESLESFHNIFMDSFWYSGYFGLFASTIGIVFLIKIQFFIKEWFYKITCLFVILGFLFGAPPFSDIFSLNLILPFLFMKYFEGIGTRDVENAPK